MAYSLANDPHRIENVAAAIANCTSNYVAEDNLAINMPWNANGFAMFADESNGLYLGDHDCAFELTAHLFRKRDEQIDAGFHRSPFLNPGMKASLSSSHTISPGIGT